MAAATLALAPGVDGTRLVIRLTALTSLILFLLAFTASAAARRWPGRWTHWQLRHRRQLGLSFAVSHATHLAAIIVFAHTDPGAFHVATTGGSIATASLGYIVIAAMSLTSFDAAVAWMGARRWRALHVAGAYYLWVSFIIAFGKRVPVSPAYAAPMALLLLALAIRLWSRHARTRKDPSGATSLG